MNTLLVYSLSFRLTPREFNSYGSRRGNDAVMARGTFANIRLVNKFMAKAGPKTKHWPSGDDVSVTFTEFPKSQLYICFKKLSRFQIQYEPTGNGFRLPHDLRALESSKCA